MENKKNVIQVKEIHIRYISGPVEKFLFEDFVVENSGTSFSWKMFEILPEEKEEFIRCNETINKELLEELYEMSQYRLLYFNIAEIESITQAASYEFCIDYRKVC